MNGPSGVAREKRFKAGFRGGFSLLELTMVVVLLAIIAWVALPRIAGNSLDARRNTCYMNVRDIEIQAELWFRDNGGWPAADLSDLGSDGAYFPDGPPRCPLGGTAYTLDSTTHRVSGHTHP